MFAVVDVAENPQSPNCLESDAFEVDPNKLVLSGTVLADTPVDDLPNVMPPDGTLLDTVDVETTPDVLMVGPVTSAFETLVGFILPKEKLPDGAMVKLEMSGSFPPGMMFVPKELVVALRRVSLLRSD